MKKVSLKIYLYNYISIRDPYFFNIYPSDYLTANISVLS